MSSCCSSRVAGIFALWSTALIATSCSPKLEVEPPLVRQQMDTLDVGYNPDDINSYQIFSEDLYAPAKSMSACGWLDTLGSGDSNSGQYFRILEDHGTMRSRSGFSIPGAGLVEDVGRFAIRSVLPITGDSKLEVEDTQILPGDPCEMRTIRFGRPGQQKTRKKMRDENRCAALGGLDMARARYAASSLDKDSLDFANLYGRVQLGDNPLYEYGLLLQLGPEFPDKQKTYDLVDEEILTSPLRILPLILARTALKSGAVNIYEVRNENAQKMVGAQMPGSYDRDFKIYPLKNTFPEVLIRSGAPHAELLRQVPLDSKEQFLNKDARLREVLATYARRTPMFRDLTWSSFKDEMRWGMSAAIRGMQSANPKEQACAAVIMHRGFAQMLSIKGYDRAPLELHKGTRLSRYVLPKIENFLESKTSQRFKVCRSTGSFLRSGKHTQVRDSELSDTSPQTQLQLAARPIPMSACLNSNARPVDIMAQPPVVTGALGKIAGASLQDKLEFMSGISYYMMAMAPGTRWWFSDKSQVPYPLADFGSKGLSEILASGGLLPYEAFAIGLGFLNLSGNSLVDQHLLYVDKDNREVSASSDDVLGIRIASEARKPFDSKIVETDIRSVLTVADVAFRLHETLENMARWFDQTEAQVRNAEAAGHGTQARADYNAMIKGLFGSKETLELLTSKQEGSLRKQVDDLRLAVTLLVARFARIEKDAPPRAIPLQENPKTGEMEPVPHATKYRYKCFAKLVLDPKSGKETPVGECSESRGRAMQSDIQAFRQTLRLMGSLYKSPLYMEMGAE